MKMIYVASQVFGMLSYGERQMLAKLEARLDAPVPEMANTARGEDGAVSGILVPVPPDPMSTGSDERKERLQVRGQVVAWAIHELNGDVPHKGGPIEFADLSIVGRLDLSGAVLGRSLHFRRCTIQCLDMRRTKLQGLVVDKCEVDRCILCKMSAQTVRFADSRSMQRFDISDGTIAGTLDLRKSTFGSVDSKSGRPVPPMPLDEDRRATLKSGRATALAIHVTESGKWHQRKVPKEVKHIEDVNEVDFKKSANEGDRKPENEPRELLPPALQARSLKVGQAVRMDCCEIHAGADFQFASIGAEWVLDGSEVHPGGPYGYAIDAHCVRVGMSLDIGSAANIKGRLQLRDAAIGGDLDISGGKFDSQERDWAINLRRARIGGSLLGRLDDEDRPTVVLGQLRLWDAEIKFGVRLLGAWLRRSPRSDLAVDARGVHVGRSFKISAYCWGVEDFPDKSKTTTGDQKLDDGKPYRRLHTMELGGESRDVQRSVVWGRIRLRNAVVNGNVEFQALLLSNQNETSIWTPGDREYQFPGCEVNQPTREPIVDARRLRCTGDVLFEHGFVGVGRIEMPSSEIGGSLRMGGAQIGCGACIQKQENGGKERLPYAFDGESMHVGGDIEMNGGFCSLGTVSLDSAEVGDQVDFRDSVVIATSDAQAVEELSPAIDMDQIRVGDSIKFGRVSTSRRSEGTCETFNAVHKADPSTGKLSQIVDELITMVRGDIAERLVRVKAESHQQGSLLETAVQKFSEVLKSSSQPLPGQCPDAKGGERGCTTVGSILLRSATVGDDLECSGLNAVSRPDDQQSNNCIGDREDSDLPHVVTVPVIFDLSNASIKGSLYLNNHDLQDEPIKEGFLGGAVALIRASIGRLDIEQPYNCVHYKVHGLRYGDVSSSARRRDKLPVRRVPPSHLPKCIASTQYEDASVLNWLKHCVQESQPGPSFSRQPFVQAAQVLERQGEDEHAEDIRIELAKLQWDLERSHIGEKLSISTAKVLVAWWLVSSFLYLSCEAPNAVVVQSILIGFVALFYASSKVITGNGPPNKRKEVLFGCVVALVGVVTYLVAAANASAGQSRTEWAIASIVLSLVGCWFGFSEIVKLWLKKFLVGRILGWGYRVHGAVLLLVVIWAFGAVVFGTAFTVNQGRSGSIALLTPPDGDILVGLSQKREELGKAVVKRLEEPHVMKLLQPRVGCVPSEIYGVDGISVGLASLGEPEYTLNLEETRRELDNVLQRRDGGRQGSADLVPGQLQQEIARVVSSNVTPRWIAEQLPPEYPRFSPMLYSLDAMLPIINLGQHGYWIPNPNVDIFGQQDGYGNEPAIARYHWRLSRWLFGSGGVISVALCNPGGFSSGEVLRGYMWFHIAVGWTGSIFLIIGLTGVVKKGGGSEMPTEGD